MLLNPFQIELALRGVKLPAKVCDLLNAAPPPQCDFVVPNHLMADLAKKKKAKPQGDEAAQPKPRKRQ